MVKDFTDLRSTLPPSDPPKYSDVGLWDSSPAITPVTSPSPSGLQNKKPSKLHNVPISPISGRRNQPYIPEKHLQGHIDKLGGSTLNLAACSTDARTEYFDILPSFQMFQSILKRNDFEFDESSLGDPPIYDDASRMVDNPSQPLSSPDMEIQRVLDSASRNLESPDFGEEADNDHDSVEYEGQYLFSEIDSEEGLQSRSRPRDTNISEASGRRSRSQTPMGSNILTHESFGDSVLDNIDMLPRSKSSPLSIDIYVTKDVPTPHGPCEMETKLKEYSSGDAVHGYVVITNNSEESVDFGLFTVSLECTVKAVYASMKGHILKPRSILQKKLLKMYDLNASYNEGAIPSSAGIEYEYLSRDRFDGCIIGLPNERILKPKEKYKKFIMFKFPGMLLDNTCPHGVFRHTMPPPSFGIDCTAFHTRASTIEINKALGYGFLNARGSPIKLKDYSFDEISVSYAIEAKFIDKLHAKDQRTPISTNDINDTKNPSQYIVSGSSQFFLRFIPDVKSQVSTYSKACSLYDRDTFDSIGINGVLYSKLAKQETWKFIKHMNLIIEQEISSALDKKEFSNEELKRKHLFGNNRRFVSSSDLTFQRTNESSRFFLQEKIKLMETNNVIFSNECVPIFARKKKRLLSYTTKVGELMICVPVPDKLLQYGSPRLIQKYNDGRKESVSILSMSQRDDMPSLHPVNSNMSELYNRTESSVISEIEIELHYKSNEENIKPPVIASVDFELVAWSYRTDYPIPFSFEHDFFYTKPHVSGAVIQHDDVEITKQNLATLKETVNHYIEFLRDTKTYISQNTFSYLKGLSKMGIKKDTIKGYLHNVTASSYFGNEEWSGEKVDYKNVLWSKSIKVPIKILNKNNITLPPSFQSCLVGRLYSIQIFVKFKGGEEGQNVAKLSVPILVG